MSTQQIRLDLGRGWVIECDPPPAKVFKALKWYESLINAGKHVTTKRDRKAFLTVRNWLEQQEAKYGGMKPAGEQPAAETLSLSLDAKAAFWETRHTPEDELFKYLQQAT